MQIATGGICGTVYRGVFVIRCRCRQTGVTKGPVIAVVIAEQAEGGSLVLIFIVHHPEVGGVNIVFTENPQCVGLSQATTDIIATAKIVFSDGEAGATVITVDGLLQLWQQGQKFRPVLGNPAVFKVLLIPQGTWCLNPGVAVGSADGVSLEYDTAVAFGFGIPVDIQHIKQTFTADSGCLAQAIQIVIDKPAVLAGRPVLCTFQCLITGETVEGGTKDPGAAVDGFDR